MPRPWAALRLASLATSLALPLAAGCARTGAPPSAPTTTPPSTPDDAVPSATTEVPPPSPGACAEGGRLWDGKPVDCSYEHAGCCYGSAAQACAAAGCDEGQCHVLESYPAQIRCAAP